MSRGLARLVITTSMVVVTAILLVAAACSSGPVATTGKTPATGKPIKVGAVFSKTGVYAVSGAALSQAVALSIDDINARGGISGHPIELREYDTESDPSKGVIAVKKLIESDQVDVIIGEGSTGMTLAEQAAAFEGKTPYVCSSGTEAFEVTLRKAGTTYWNFRPHSLASSANSSEKHEFFKLMGFNKIGVIYADTAYGTAGNASSKLYAEMFNQQIVLSMAYAANATEFGAVTAAIKSHPEMQVLLIHGAELASGLAIAAIREAGITVPIQAAQSIFTKEVISVKKVWDAANAKPGVYNLTNRPDIWQQLPNDDPAKPLLVSFDALMFSKLGKHLETSDQFMSQGNVLIIKNALEKLFQAQPNILDKPVADVRQAVRDSIETNTQNFWNGFGLFSMTPDYHIGLQVGTFTHVSQYQDGKLVYLPQYKFTDYKWTPDYAWIAPFATKYLASKK